jgi:hypothetical protein
MDTHQNIAKAVVRREYRKKIFTRQGFTPKKCRTDEQGISNDEVGDRKGLRYLLLVGFTRL